MKIDNGFPFALMVDLPLPALRLKKYSNRKGHEENRFNSFDTSFFAKHGCSNCQSF
jgi:hypothetical protein